jgi:hypothetical protein
MITPSFSLTATERVLPRLALDFTTATLDSRVTFTRSGDTATVINSSGLVSGINADLPRFDYDPVSLACRGLLIEETRTNLITYSEDLGDASWTKSGTTVSANATASPDGTANADKVLETSATSTHFAFPAIAAVTSGVAYTGVYYFKAGENTFIQLTFSTTQFGSGQYANFNLSTGAVTAESGGVARISNAGDGWYRCSFTATCSTSGNATCFPVLIRSALIGRLPSYAGDSSRGLYVWGAQLEAGAFPTSYIPTEASALTRNADVATMTGTNFSDWFNAAEGTFAVTYIPYSTAASPSQRVIYADAGSTSNRVYFTSTSTNQIAVTSGGVSQAIVSAGTVTANQSNTVAGYYKANAFNVAGNATAGTKDTSGSVPVGVNNLRFFRDAGSTNSLFGHLQKMNFWNIAVTDAELAAFSK